MINRGRNKVLCDNCKSELNMKKIPIESKYIDEIRIQFFRCPSCHEKYLIDVTDKVTREKQIEYAKLVSIQENIRNLFKKENAEAIEKQSRENIEKMETLLKEIKEKKTMLKEKYYKEL